MKQLLTKQTIIKVAFVRVGEENGFEKWSLDLLNLKVCQSFYIER